MSCKKRQQRDIKRMNILKPMLDRIPSPALSTLLEMEEEMEPDEKNDMVMDISHLMAYCPPNAKGLGNLHYTASTSVAVSLLLDILQALPENAAVVMLSIDKAQPLRIMVDGDPKWGAWYIAPHLLDKEEEEDENMEASA